MIALHENGNRGQRTRNTLAAVLPELVAEGYSAKSLSDASLSQGCHAAHVYR